MNSKQKHVRKPEGHHFKDCGSSKQIKSQKSGLGVGLAEKEKVKG